MAASLAHRRLGARATEGGLRRVMWPEILKLPLKEGKGVWVGDLRWCRMFGQGPEIVKWNVQGDHAADLIAGSVAKHASSGV
jgi:hypothetical protein